MSVMNIDTQDSTRVHVRTLRDFIRLKLIQEKEKIKFCITRSKYGTLVKVSFS